MRTYVFIETSEHKFSQLFDVINICRLQKEKDAAYHVPVRPSVSADIDIVQVRVD